MVQSNEIAFVLRGKNRVKVMTALQGKELISRQIEKETGMYKSHANRTLKELQIKKLIFCTNLQDRSFKFYKLTLKGKKVLIELQKVLSSNK